MDKPTIYIENTIVSYLTARPSRHILAAAWQQVTRDWWETRRPAFDLYTSELVLAEAAAGDTSAAANRLAALEGIPVLLLTGAVESLARALLDQEAVPEKTNADAVHIAAAAVHGMACLLTWNCTDIDNAEAKSPIRSVCAVEGDLCPFICCPYE